MAIEATKSNTPRFGNNQFTNAEHGGYSPVLQAEASDLGFAPGSWPERILVGDRVYNVFLLSEFHRKTDGDVECVLYRQLGGGSVLRVFND